ncbi:MAG: hypothetical protein JO043_02595 [Candidatus Eremiobacteraeota bacterium]|nr:hypothetical protein [Candidatus Eremiobacteraeota bacterium]
MRFHLFVTAAVLTSLSAGALVSCSLSGSASPPAKSLAAAGTRSTTSLLDVAAARNLPTDVASRLPLSSTPMRVRPDTSGAPKLLAVADFGTLAVEILNSSYHLKTTISSGLSEPVSDWYDTAGNLYVADVHNGIVEYAPGATSPTYVYSNGTADAIEATTDEAQHVYASNHNLSNGGYITEYAHRSNTVLHQCTVGNGAGLQGIAVDEKGDVFASVDTTGGPGFVEFKRGLSGCKQTVLGAIVSNTGGMQLDNKNDLVECDQTAHTVDIVAPPYKKVTSTITGFADPYNVALNKNNTLVFVADPQNRDVVVDNYPSGTNVTTLGSSNGLNDPAGPAVNPVER